MTPANYPLTPTHAACPHSLDEWIFLSRRKSPYCQFLPLIAFARSKKMGGVKQEDGRSLQVGISLCFTPAEASHSARATAAATKSLCAADRGQLSQPEAQVSLGREGLPPPPRARK